MSSVYGDSCEPHSDVVMRLPPSYMSPPPSWICPLSLASQLMKYGLTIADSIAAASPGLHGGGGGTGAGPHMDMAATAASKIARCSVSLWQPPLVLEYRMYRIGDPAPMPDSESLSELVFGSTVCTAFGDSTLSITHRWLTLGSPAAHTLLM